MRISRSFAQAFKYLTAWVETMTEVLNLHQPGLENYYQHLVQDESDFFNAMRRRFEGEYSAAKERYRFPRDGPLEATIAIISRLYNVQRVYMNTSDKERATCATRMCDLVPSLKFTESADAYGVPATHKVFVRMASPVDNNALSRNTIAALNTSDGLALLSLTGAQVPELFEAAPALHGGHNEPMIIAELSPLLHDGHRFKHLCIREGYRWIQREEPWQWQRDPGGIEPKHDCKWLVQVLQGPPLDCDSVTPLARKRQIIPHNAYAVALSDEDRRIPIADLFEAYCQNGRPIFHALT
jgi:hypothetical protein